MAIVSFSWSGSCRHTNDATAQVGLGKYGPFVGRHRGEDQDKYWTFEYVTKIDASFPWYRIGDPDATVHREWANAIIEELSFSFDEESLWTRTKGQLPSHESFYSLT